jgi:hypothetical protein
MKNSEEIKTFKTTVNKYEDTLKKYQRLFIEDEKKYIKEQESLDKLFDIIKSIKLKIKKEEKGSKSGINFDFKSQKTNIPIFTADDIKMEFPLDNPINKKISGNFNVTLESFVTVQDWSLKKTEKEFIGKKTIELDSELFEEFHTYFNTEVELFIWSRAQLIDYNHIEDSYVLELEKEFYVKISIDKKGNYTILDSNESSAKEKTNKNLEKYSLNLEVRHKYLGKQSILNLSVFENSKEIATINPGISIEGIEFISSYENELFFKKEGETKLSGEQIDYLIRWWDGLDHKLKLKIETKKAKIKVIGFASSTGGSKENSKIAKQRAENVQKELIDIIGTNTEGKPIAMIHASSKGEATEGTEKIVKINIIEL